MIIIFNCTLTYSQTVLDPEYISSQKVEELLFQIKANSKNIGDFVAYRINHNINLSVSEIFEAVKIKTEMIDNNNIIGFDIKGNKLFDLNINKKIIFFSDTVVQLSENELLQKGNVVFLSTEIISKILCSSIQIILDELMINLTTSYKLPFEIINEREIISKQVRNIPIPKRIFAESEKLIDGFSVDWGLNAYKYFTNSEFNYFGYFRSGARLFYGDLNTSFSFGNSQRLFNANNNYSWRYYYNNSGLFKQIIIGDFNSGYRGQYPVYGAKITNIQPYPKKIFANEDISKSQNICDQNELLINGKTFHSMNDDVSSKIRVPISYGMNNIELKKYDEYGKDIGSTINIYIPNDMMKKNDFEYSLSFGRLKYYNYKTVDLFASYGLNNKLTLLFGNKYIDSKLYFHNYPFANVLYRLASSCVINTEISINNRNGIKLNFYHPTSFNGEIGYYMIKQGSFLNRMNMKSEFSISANLPFHLNDFHFGTNINSRSYYYHNTGYYSMIFSNIYVGYKSLNMNLLVNNSISGNDYYKQKYMSYLFRTSCFFLHGLYGSVAAEYQKNSKKISYVSSYLSSRIYRNWDVSFNFSKNLLSKTADYNFVIRWNLPSLNLQSDYYGGNNTISGVQGFGSFMYVKKENSFLFSNNSLLNRSNVQFYPFLDANMNGRKDEDEEVINRRTEINAENDMTIGFKDKPILVDIESYENSYVSLNRYSDYTVNLKEYFCFQPVPNILNRIFIPVQSVSTITGSVVLPEINYTLIRNFYLRLFDIVTNEVYIPEIFSNGDYSFSGIKNGKYELKIDSIITDSIIYKPYPNVISLSVNADKEDNIYEGNDFVFVKNLKLKIQPSNDSMMKQPDKDKILMESRYKLSHIEEIKNYSFAQIKRLDSSVISYLKTLASVLKSNKKYKIIIESYTDNSGDFIEKIKRSLLILKITKKVFVDFGVPAERIESIPRGDSKPVYSNLTSYGRKQNNRLVIRLVLIQ